MTRDPESLFHGFERRPDSCQACLVNYDNIERLAAYYSTGGFNTEVVRHGHDTTLVLHPLDEERDGANVIRAEVGEVVVYGHPPVVQPREAFLGTWRPEIPQ